MKRYVKLQNFKENMQSHQSKCNNSTKLCLKKYLIFPSKLLSYTELRVTRNGKARLCKKCRGDVLQSSSQPLETSKQSDSCLDIGFAPFEARYDWAYPIKPD